MLFPEIYHRRGVQEEKVINTTLWHKKAKYIFTCSIANAGIQFKRIKITHALVNKSFLLRINSPPFDFLM